MPLTFRILPLLLSLLPLFPSDKDASDADGNGPGDQGKDNDGQRDADALLGDAGKKALKAERDRADEAERTHKTLEKRLKELEQTQREAAEAKAKEEGDYKQLLEEREKELADLKAEQANDRIARLREKYGAKERIPEELWTKIDGDDEDAIKADAKALAKHLGGPDAPDDDAGERSRENGKKTKKNDAYKDPSHWL